MSLTVLALVTAAAVVVWRMSWLAPTWWAPPDAADPRVAEAAQQIEYSLIEQAHMVRTDDETWSIRIHDRHVNAWLASRLGAWLAHDQALDWQGGFGRPQMRSEPGWVTLAIELDGDGVRSTRVIGDAEPQGICGSGLIDLISELRRTGRMNELGVFEDGSTEFVFEPKARLTLSRADLSALAQAKSANYCGQSIVLGRYGLPLGEYKKFYLAGGFANYINVRSAANIGFVANVEDDRVVKVGNASLAGATIMLLSGPLRQRMEELVREIEHVELETEPDFFDLFVEGCQFKPMIA